MTGKRREEVDKLQLLAVLIQMYDQLDSETLMMAMLNAAHLLETSSQGSAEHEKYSMHLGVIMAVIDGRIDKMAMMG